MAGKTEKTGNQTEKKKTVKKTVTTVNKSENGKKSAGKGTKSGTKTPKPSAEEKRKAQQAAEAAELAAQKRRERRAKNMTWILALVGALLLILMIFDWISIFGMRVQEKDVSAHLLGVAGYYFFHAVYGVFGYGFLLLPFVLFWLGMVWRNAVREQTVRGKLISAGVFLLLFSAMLHLLFNWAALGDERFTLSIAELYENGQALKSGGFFGGLLSVGLMKLLNYVGSLIVYVIGLCICAVFFFGIDPTVLIDRIRANAHEKAQRRAQNRAAENAKKKEEEERRRQEEREAAAVRRAEKSARKAADKAEKAGKKDGRDEDESEEIEEIEGIEEVEEIEEIEKIEKSKESADRNTEETEETKEITAETAEEPEADAFADDDFDDDAEAERVFPRGRDTRYGAGGQNACDPDADEDPMSVPEEIEVDLPDENGADADADAALPDGYERADDDDSVLPDRYREDTVASLAEDIFDRSEDDAAEESDRADDQTPADAEDADKPREYVFPPLSLLKEGNSNYGGDPAELSKNIEILNQTLASFRVKVSGITAVCGPTVTRYEVRPEAGVRVHAISNLQDDIAMTLAKSGVRIEAPIPGKAAVGIEVPNDKPSAVNLRNLLEVSEFTHHKSKIAAALGADVAGNPVICDLEKMPHLLIAGTTGSGKSVCINSIIMSILYHAKPEDVKLILIDPKKVEFNVYKEIPHLCTQIVSDPKRAAGALQSAVTEMERRFEQIEEVGVRNIEGYNEITKNDPERPFMPRIVIIIDELADLMMTAPDEVETAICRIAQKARAAGIHLIIGTQRPSVDVITGLIKANVPSRIAFTVASQVDSRTIIDISGAEKLCGRGDMLYMPIGCNKPRRVQGAFVSDAEVEEVVTYVKSHNDRVHYDEVFTRHIDEEAANVGVSGKKSGDGGGVGAAAGGSDDDSKLWEAVELAVESGKISTSLMQRRLEIGYGRAAKIIDRMEELGFVGPADGNKPRKILITKEDIAQLKMNDRDA